MSNIELKAINRECLTGYEARFGCGKERDKACHVVSTTKATERDALDDFIGAFGNIRVDLGADDAGADRIYGDIRAEFLGERAGHAQNAGFCGSIGKPADGCGHTPGKCIERRHGNNAAAALFQHMWRRMLDIIEAAFQVDGDRAVELIFRNVENANRGRTACIVEQKVKTAKCFNGLCDDFTSPLVAGNIGHAGDRLDAEAFNFGCGCRQFHFQQINQRNVIARTRQIESASLSDASCPASNNGNLVL